MKTVTKLSYLFELKCPNAPCLQYECKWPKTGDAQETTSAMIMILFSSVYDGPQAKLHYDLSAITQKMVHSVYDMEIQNDVKLGWQNEMSAMTTNYVYNEWKLPK